MKKFISEKQLFFTGFIQVALVGMNVVFITKGYLFFMFITGTGIALLWSYNIKKIVFGNNKDRFIYAFGAGFGTLVGYFISKFIITII